MKLFSIKALRLAFLAVLMVVLTGPDLLAQTHSIARKWNEVVLEGIRGDFARPTVHARNLHHISAAMYDAWAVYESGSKPYFLGNNIDGYGIPYLGSPAVTDTLAAQEMAMSYAAYRLISWRFLFSPGQVETQALADSLMTSMGYSIFTDGLAYETGGPAELGNYIANRIILYGLQDEAQEPVYNNVYYNPVNIALAVATPGNPDMTDPNRWQPLVLDSFVDQSGNPIAEIPDFLSPEWGNVHPFSMSDTLITTYSRDGDDYQVWMDPGAPPYLDTVVGGALYQEGFAMVAAWSSHLDPTDGVMWDISPASIGNTDYASFPATFADFGSFYDFENGGVGSTGRALNPVTGLPYVAQSVPRGDYARVLAEFWADGPESETPPGHWFTILNYVNDNPLLVRKWNGIGDEYSELEWDILCYFSLGGTMHDAAVASWSIKGWYDYLRPVSAIRYLAERGQSSDPLLPSYDPAGIPLTAGLTELVMAGDPLEGIMGEHIGKVKVYTWRGPDFVLDPATDVAGVDWILAENWWPFQRPTFVTPPFAGYISGHSTYSRAAAELLTNITGSEYFPGGLGEFFCPQNEFLVFEDGPSIDITLQWATYQDASDECSLSRIWGGIHPPADDVPGRKIGYEIGHSAFDFAASYIFNPDPCISDADGDGICDDIDDCIGDEVTISALSLIDETTCRSKDAGISLDWNGGAGPYSVTINELYTLGPYLSGPQNLTGVSKGFPVRTVLITDLSSGCMVTDSVFMALGGPDKPEFESIIITEAPCGGNGLLTIDIDDAFPGNGNLFVKIGSAEFGPFASEPIALPIPVGSYPTVVVKDDLDCLIFDNSGFVVAENDTCLLRIDGAQTGVSLFPNPAGESVTINLTGLDPDFITLIDPLGREVESIKFEGRSLSFDLKALSPGVYTIKWDGEEAGSTTVIHF